VHGHGVPGEQRGNTVVRQPAAIGQAGGRDGRASLRRVPDAVDGAAQREGSGGQEEELLELVRPLAVAPVADPDQIVLTRGGPRLEEPGVGRLVPRPRPVRPPPVEIEIAHGRTKGEDAVVVRQVEALHLLRLRHRAVVRVVEEEPERAVVAGQADSPDELRLVPLVHEHEAGAVEGRVEVQRLEVVEGADRSELGECTPVVVESSPAAFLEEVCPAPAVARLERADLVAAGEQLARDAAQEVRVAMVPVAGERVAEEHHLHAASLCVTSAYASRYAAAIASAP
jgi:hypothetical protein